MYSVNMGNDGDYDWEKEVEEFEKTKAGVKGLVDSGVVKIPRFFIDQSEKSSNVAQLQIPVIDFQELKTRRMEIVEEIRKASEIWGFFQMVNHGVPMSAMDAILEGTRKFHEQTKESKMEYYSTDMMRKVKFYTILGTLQKSHAASWRDAFSCTFTDDMLDPAAIPPVCRNEIAKYMKFMMKLRDTLSDLLSEALGLSRDFLRNKQFLKSESLSCLYYPACPEPEKTFGTEKHADPTILTVLVQDDTGGLQIHHENYWVDVPPIKGALIANIGSFMQV
ncbi:1-aminocyclopropane-1-carboxylate oxidase homolog 1-like [Olea europaea subsp. europaea]|uniref:1-aminocyclopropane-1-carboxylate oxidase homolog 1-like n=1 Tax=Olea europaea subsp. europaea TaxID=158383 RepID=A0A8S0RZR2_OLEEU|nr:1-aminocyclopropane-1-carboxylate oxidase homolog 1-like [Olea europaea subsp. europaea]